MLTKRPAAREIASIWPLRFSSVLHKLADGSRQFFGEDVEIEPLAEIDRPFSSLLRIRAVPLVASHRATDAFVKILKPRGTDDAQIASMRRNLVRDFEMTKNVQRGLGGLYDDLGAVRPIACFPEELAMVTEEAPGTTLAGFLGAQAAGWPRRASVSSLASAFARVGGWLTAVQALMPVPGESPVITSDGLRTYVDRRLNELEDAQGMRLSRDGRARLTAHHEALIAAASAMGELRAVWIHADFCPDNILVHDGGRRITVLDFTMAKSGTEYHDLAHLYMHLDVMMTKPWFRRGVIEHLQRALLESFEPGLSPRQPLFELSLLHHVLCHLLALDGASGHAVTRLYVARVQGRHRRWLSRVAGLDAGSWTR